MSLIRMLAIDKGLLKSVMDSAGENQQAKIEILTKEKAEILSRISDLEAKINKWMTNFESSEDPGLVEVITSRISGYKQSIIEMQSTIEEIDRDIVKLRHPVENLEKLTSSYQYFWNRWQGLKFTDRQRIVKTIIKELRLYSESPKHYRLEIDLFGDVKLDIPTGKGGGGGKVRISLRKSTVDPNDIRILTWSIHFVRNNWRNTSNAKITVAEDSFPSISQHLLFQQILLDEIDALMDLVKTPPPKQLADLESAEK